MEHIHIHHLRYNPDTLEEHLRDNSKVSDLQQAEEGMFNWYDVRGLHDTEMVEKFGKVFQIHPLVLEDIVDTQQRPKFEEYETGNYLLFRDLKFIAETKKIKTQQVSVYFGKNFLLSFQEEEDDLFESVRERLRTSGGRIRRRGVDYLAYALLDNVVDNYFLTLDEVEAVIEDLEFEVLENPNSHSKAQIHHLKQEMLVIRKSITPLREAIGQFSKSENEFINENTFVFIRDLYDHTIQIMDMVETYRDILNGVQDLYLSELSYKMNNVMQVLTIITTIFVPLSFLVGLYGMNFDNMPELHWKYSYFILLGLMVIIAISLLNYFRRKNWL
ncbi:MAG: magnesium and cobalt transport protein CorA [Saprospiraceae bacterium]|nr:MAG: magnesium and cobalt transport protein CorA [Saprospiraceae bacterium]